MFFNWEKNSKMNILHIVCWPQWKYMRVMQSKFTKYNPKKNLKGGGGGPQCPGPGPALKWIKVRLFIFNESNFPLTICKIIHAYINFDSWFFIIMKTVERSIMGLAPLLDSWWSSQHLMSLIIGHVFVIHWWALILRWTDFLIKYYYYSRCFFSCKLNGIHRTTSLNISFFNYSLSLLK